MKKWQKLDTDTFKYGGKIEFHHLETNVYIQITWYNKAEVRKQQFEENMTYVSEIVNTLLTSNETNLKNIMVIKK